MTDTAARTARRSRATAAIAIIRPYRPADRAAVRAICCRTAFRNRGAAAVTRDDELFADYWTRYYTDHEPESLLVAEVEGRVVAYLSGCVHTRRYVRTMGRRIVPGVMVRLAWRRARGSDRGAPRSRAFLRWLVRDSWREAPSLPAEAEAAHYHCNVLPEGYGQRLYSRLGLAFLATLERRGVARVGGRLFERRQGPGPHRMVEGFLREHPSVRVLVAERPTRLGAVLGMSGDFVTRAVVLDVADLRRFLAWMADRYGL
jgi:hypothetical protein